MDKVLLFRICLLIIFVIMAWRYGKWNKLYDYYPTILFVIAIDVSASFITYHYSLWCYSPDTLVKTQTTVELLNSYIMLPATTLVYLSYFPDKRRFRYILKWVLFYSSLEFMDKTLGGIYYRNGWSWQVSIVFDIFMFIVIRTHYKKPAMAWAVSLIMTLFILIYFGFVSGEYK